MLEVHARVTHELDAQMRAEHGLSVSAYEVLMFLADAPDHRLRMADIARPRPAEPQRVHPPGRPPRRSRATSSAPPPTTDGRGLFAAAHRRPASRRPPPRAAPTARASERFFLAHLSATDEVALGDAWSRVLAATRP